MQSIISQTLKPQYFVATEIIYTIRRFILFPFKNDKDLVHEFVTHSGLTCLVTVGSQSEHTHQNYILRGKL